VSTTVTPLPVMKTEVLPPPPFSTYRLSFSLVTISALADGCGGLLRHGNRDGAKDQQRAEDDASFHALPPKGEIIAGFGVRIPDSGLAYS
jgi:hypothetical protein